ncbi:MAG: hypothetical protein WD382_01080 [Halofilum sp. (in: g-proteobacteria)]
MDTRSLNWNRAAYALLVFGPVLVILLITGTVGLTTSVSPYTLISDPASITDSPFYVGAVTNIGVLMWWSTATVCLFAYTMAARLYPGRTEHRFLLWIGLLTAVLALDDMFLLHENVAPIHFGIQETTVYATYAAIAAFLFLRFRRSILASDYYLLLIAAFFFVCSQLIDVARGWGMGFYGVGFIEEACKLLGIAGWLGYFAYLSARHVAGELAPANSASAADTASDHFDHAALQTSRSTQSSYTESSAGKTWGQKPSSVGSLRRGFGRRRNIPR